MVHVNTPERIITQRNRLTNASTRALPTFGPCWRDSDAASCRAYPYAIRKHRRVGVLKVKHATRRRGRDFRGRVNEQRSHHQYATARDGTRDRRNAPRRRVNLLVAQDPMRVSARKHAQWSVLDFRVVEMQA